MNGVEILAMEEVAVDFEFDMIAFLIATIVFMALGTLAGWLFDISNNVNGWLIGLIISCIMGLIMGVAIGSSSTANPTECETEYKVTISDEVLMNDFLDRYEIIGQEGKIYTVKERGE